MKLDSKRGREIALVVLVALAAGLANLPEELLDQVGIDRGFLLGSLALMVFIALFLYLKFQFFFLVVLLAIAANMPAEVAENLGISTLPLLIAMATMVGFSVINYVVDLLPTGLEKKPREQSAEGIKVLFYAGRRHGDRARLADRLAGVRRHPEEGARRAIGARAGGAIEAAQVGPTLFPGGSRAPPSVTECIGLERRGTSSRRCCPNARYRDTRRPPCTEKGLP